MSAERYLNHPTFGLLYRVCPAGEAQEVYATLYENKPPHEAMWELLGRPPKAETEKSRA